MLAAVTDGEPMADGNPELFERIQEKLANQFLGGQLGWYQTLLIEIVVTIIVAVVAHYIARTVIVGVIRRLVRHTRTQWDDFLVERRLFNRIAHLVPSAVIYFLAQFYPASWQEEVANFALGYMVFIGLLICTSFLNAVSDIYGTLELSRKNPIGGFIQGIKLLIWILGGILFVATLTGRDPWGLVAGIGAITAVLLLVFKDAILGLVASIQIFINKMVNVGDWIEMPKYGIDGDVIDISLTTIKVQNFDKTISTIPTYAFITDTFRNWRGMQESGGRRIKRSICIDMNSIKFCSEEMIQRFEKFQFLSDYVRQKRKELDEFNRKHNIDTSEIINGRRMTNIGTFRAYLKAYLSHHEKIDKAKTFLIRQLPPSEKGLPIEIYVFSNDTRWVNYEDIQAGIFDHILAVIPRFELRVFQNPSGNDFQSLALRPAIGMTNA